MFQSSNPSFNGQNQVGISFIAEIYSRSAAILITALADVAKTHDEIFLLFSSPGGDAEAGMAIYHFIKALPVPVTIYNIGIIDSIGNVVYQAGSRRLCAETACFRFRGIEFDVDENGGVGYRQTIGSDCLTKKDEETISDFMVRHTNLEHDDLDRLIRDMGTIESHEAEALGVADRVGDIVLPKGTQVTQLITQE